LPVGIGRLSDSIFENEGVDSMAPDIPMILLLLRLGSIWMGRRDGPVGWYIHEKA
jgi:hypothetical protein